MNKKFRFICMFVIGLLLFTMASATIYAKSKQVIKGSVRLVTGKAFVKKNGKWIALKIKSIVNTADTIKLNKNSRVMIRLTNGKQLDIKGAKTMKVGDLLTASAKKKTMNSLISKLKKSRGLSRYSPTAVAGVRGDDISKMNKKVKFEDLIWQ